MTVLRDGKEKKLSITPGEKDGKPYVGIDMIPGFRFPFQVSVDIADNIGGPSAGLMMSMAIFDTLTPGSSLPTHGLS